VRRHAIFIAGSVAYTGFFPYAPATFTTLVLGLGFWAWGPGSLALAVLLAASLLIAVPVATRMERALGDDPSACTIDELVGYLIALQGCDLAAPGAWRFLVAAFFLFRFFDILKIWPGRRLERLPRGWGIVADDVLAGLYSLVLVRLVAGWIA
jgi:phosphatidylglycerophosphatase A